MAESIPLSKIDVTLARLLAAALVRELRAELLGNERPRPLDRDTPGTAGEREPVV